MAAITILSAVETKELLTMRDVIQAVSQVYSQKAQGDTVVFPLVFHEFEPGVADMDIKSGWVKGANVFGLKLVSWFGENKEKDLPLMAGTVLVCDDKTGYPIGILDGAYVTSVRTGAAGALGAQYLGRKDSENFLMVGAGHIAKFQIAATLTLMPQIKKIRIYDPIVFSGAEALANNCRTMLKEEFGIEVGEDVSFEAVEDIEKATRDSHIIITATPSRKPIIMEEWVQPGTHLSCIGADMKGKQEIDGKILTKARVFADDALQSCNVGELEIPLTQGIIQKDIIVGELGHIINGCVVGRENEEQITVYDATGTALLDLIVAKLALDKAKEKNLGTEVTL